MKIQLMIQKEEKMVQLFKIILIFLLELLKPNLRNGNVYSSHDLNDINITGQNLMKRRNIGVSLSIASLGKPTNCIRSDSFYHINEYL